MLWSKTTSLKQRSQWWFLTPLPCILYTQPSALIKRENGSRYSQWQCVIVTNLIVCLHCWEEWDFINKMLPAEIQLKWQRNFLNITWLAHCYSQLTFFHMGRKYCRTCKSYRWFTEFFLCAKVAHLLKSPAVSLGCCWTCLARYSKSVVDQ